MMTSNYQSFYLLHLLPHSCWHGHLLDSLPLLVPAHFSQRSVACAMLTSVEAESKIEIPKC